MKTIKLHSKDLYYQLLSLPLISLHELQLENVYSWYNLQGVKDWVIKNKFYLCHRYDIAFDESIEMPIGGRLAQLGIGNLVTKE